MSETKHEAPFDCVNFMMDWEAGTLGEHDTIRLFQHLVDTGLAWTLQGMYGRQAQAMIDAGLIHQPQDNLNPKE